MTKGDDVTVVQMETVGTGTLGEVRSRTGPGDPGPDPDRWLDGVLGAVTTARDRVLRGAPGLDDGQLERGLVATEAVRRAVDGLELALVAEVGRRGEERGPDGRYREVRLPAGTVADMAPDAVAVATGIGPTEASRRCAVASRAATDLAALAALVAEGRGTTMAGQHDCIVLEASEKLFEHVGEEFAELLRGVGFAHAAGEERIAGKE